MFGKSHRKHPSPFSANQPAYNRQGFFSASPSPPGLFRIMLLIRLSWSNRDLAQFAQSLFLYPHVFCSSPCFFHLFYIYLYYFDIISSSICVFHKIIFLFSVNYTYFLLVCAILRNFICASDICCTLLRKSCYFALLLYTKDKSYDILMSLPLRCTGVTRVCASGHRHT